jgi:hypothetical protein
MIQFVLLWEGQQQHKDVWTASSVYSPCKGIPILTSPSQQMQCITSITRKSLTASPAEDSSFLFRIPIRLKDKSNRCAPIVEDEVLEFTRSGHNVIYIKTRKSKSMDFWIGVLTGETDRKLRRYEFAARNVAMKLMRLGCCLSLHEVLIMHTPRPARRMVPNWVTEISTRCAHAIKLR